MHELLRIKEVDFIVFRQAEKLRKRNLKSGFAFADFISGSGFRFNGRNVLKHKIRRGK